MTVVINGTTGLSGVDGSAGTPAIQGSDTNTGVLFPAADTVAISTGGSERMRVDSSGNLGLGVTPSAWSEGRAIERKFAGTADWGYLQAESYRTTNAYYNGGWKYGGTGAAASYAQVGAAHQWFSAASGTAGNAITFTQAMTLDASGNLGVGTSSPSYKLDVSAGSNGSGVVNIFRLQNVGTTVGDGAKILFTAGASTDGAGIASTGVALNSADLRFYTGGNTERMRIESSGALLVNTTTSGGWNSNAKFETLSNSGSAVSAYFTGTGGGQAILCRVDGTTPALINFFKSTTNVGNITTNGTTTAYNTSSDYRLKHDIAPMTGALAKVQALKPVTYKWKSDGSDSEGFIAHELAEVVPQCVTGEKDAIDAEGNPIYQGIDTSFLVATLTAAIQEQQALIQSLTDRITQLENK